MTALVQRHLAGSRWVTLRAFSGPSSQAQAAEYAGATEDRSRIIDTWNHTCPNHVAPTYGDPPRLTPQALATGYPCEGCVAESYLLDWLTQHVLGLGAQVQELEAGKVYR